MKTFFVLDPDSGELNKHQYQYVPIYCPNCGNRNVHESQYVGEEREYVCADCHESFFMDTIVFGKPLYRERLVRELKK